MRHFAKRLDALENRRAGKGLPILIISQQDGVYRYKDRTYTEAEVADLEKNYQLIIVCYGDWPPEAQADDGREHRTIQLTWGDEIETD